ncbi:MAG: acyl-CoA dehydrogenase family protein, partial [Chloroflexi bacterium]|nr:acyl-CoA dehydrogenase family protein [Chloroflexota bacterium]
MDFRLSDQERMLQEAARQFAEGEVRPIAAALDRGAPFPHEAVKLAGELGYLGLPYPADVGGAGAGYLGLGIVVEQLARA